ncbi:phage portal protein [Ameyamaea chiangmaiensis NBRC 103196]|uniref:phage portal protein n=1 Tax=Ameyamaea chiangmaiensis TaxID=442969 RepID=UPI00210F0149|nr:phage portal protein [Ameyamaea chiangmaiensis]GBQ63846.1 phage portal protein [Ameyamaea chiangmaiensis NBRC 103196]
MVEDSVALLFGDCHWPDVVSDDHEITTALRIFASDTNLAALMTEAAIRGSIGSTAILFEIESGKPRLRLLDTSLLDPVWDEVDGDLLRVSERFIVAGQALRDRGFSVSDDDLATRFVWHRVWDRSCCIVYEPCKVGSSEGANVDRVHTIIHDFGFVPIVWIRNLAAANSTDRPDGECTFERAIDTVIEADYLLSQAGRGLKYSSDPTLVLKTGGINRDPVAREGGVVSALTLPPEGDAKLLEINGNSANAVLNHYRELRALVLEQLHGSRAHADHLTSQVSGKAMERLNQPLIWIAERLRHSYGRGGLVQIYRMACEFSKRLSGGLVLSSGAVIGMEPLGLGLRWPPWYPPGEGELQQLSASLQTAIQGGFMDAGDAAHIFMGAVNIAGHRIRDF